MHFQHLTCLASCATVVSAMASVIDPASYTNGFLNAKSHPSAGGNAICVTGIVPVKATSSMNVKLNFQEPANQTSVTGTFIEFVRTKSTLLKRVMGSTTTVSGTYNISATFCAPKNGLNPQTVQLLTHGIGFGKGYWNFASTAFSYIDAAAAAGYATLSYDRLGVGASAHPDPIQVVQTPLEVEIAHQLALNLQSGKYASTRFKNVIGVGHSFGSVITQALTAKYPDLLSAAVLTGFSTNTAGQIPFISALDLTIASLNRPKQFKDLSNGYLITNNAIGNQFAFLAGPSAFPAANLALVEATKQTVTFGELFTMSSVMGVAKEFTGPVDIVNGEYDLPFCDGNCNVPSNLAAQVKGQLYPKASSGSAYYLAANAGHGLNAQYSARDAYAQIQSFVKKNGF